MERIVEPELMESEEQSEAYAAADFAASNTQFLDLLFARHGADRVRGAVLDLGCGDGDILFRLAERAPACEIVGVDGSQAMLEHGMRRLEKTPIRPHRLAFIRGLIPTLPLRKHSFDLITSNSLLHHLHQPGALWETVLSYGRPGSAVFVMDLFRPESSERAQAIVERYAGGAPTVLRRDFHNSLLAAFRVEEVRAQLDAHHLSHFEVSPVSDRHLAVVGVI